MLQLTGKCGSLNDTLKFFLDGCGAVIGNNSMLSSKLIGRGGSSI